MKVLRLGAIFFWVATTSYAQPIIDFHSHIASPENFGKDAITGEALIKQMREAHVDQSVVLSLAYFFNSEAQAQKENNFVISESKKYPGKLIPFCGVDPNQVWAMKELARCHDVLKMKGLKLHFPQNKFSLRKTQNKEKLKKLLELAQTYEYPVLIHNQNWDSNETIELYRFTFRYPKIKFIIAHALTMNFRDLYHLIEIYEVNPDLIRNVYVDISSTVNVFADSPEKPTLKWYLRKLGIKNVLWGSDYFAFSQKDSLKALKSYAFRTEELKLMLSTNALNVLTETSQKLKTLQ